MIVLNERYTGLLARCPNCYALLGYKPEDVSNTQNIHCPQCKASMWVPFNPTYDGVIKEESEEKKDGEPVVSKQSGSGESNSESK